MRCTLAVSSILALASVLPAAPLPVRPKPSSLPVQLRPGAWTLTWNGAVCPAELHADGTFRCCYCGMWWEGRWGWDASTRRLYVEESAGHDLFCWHAELDARLSGKVRIEQQEHDLSLVAATPGAEER